MHAAEFQSWEKTDPATLFDAPTLKAEANPKARVCRHLQQEAKGCDYLVLWWVPPPSPLFSPPPCCAALPGARGRTGAAAGGGGM